MPSTEPRESHLNLLNLAVLNQDLLDDLFFLSDVFWHFAIINYELSSFGPHLCSMRANDGTPGQVDGARVGLPDKRLDIRGPSG